MNKLQIFSLGEINLELFSHPLVWKPTSFAINFAPLLEAYLQPSSCVLEMGLGSGVLSVLASKLGAAKVTALDCNPFSIEVANKNWSHNQCDEHTKDFRLSDRWSAMQISDQGAYDLVWSNPPVLPQLESTEIKKLTRNDYEISGQNGRDVLDSIITGSGQYLRDDGQLLTIATSLQGWKKTETLLNHYWHQWEIIQHAMLELTEECKHEYVSWWLEQEKLDSEKRVYFSQGKWLHDVWFLRAWHPR